MSSFNKNLLVAGFTLALFIVALHHATADCSEFFLTGDCSELTTGVKCKFNDMCVDMCLNRPGGYTGGYCSIYFLYCMCTRPCAAQSMTAAPAEKQLAGSGDGGRMGMAN